MSLTIVAFRDKGWYNEQKTEFRLYDHLCRAYDVELKMVKTIEEVENLKNNKEIIIFDEKGDIPLEKFEHIENAFYIFGRTGQDLKHDFPNAISVKIETDKPIPLFGAVACGIVLEDRRRKKWQSQ